MRLPRHREGFGNAACGPVCAGEVLAGDARVAVLGAEDPLLVGEQPLEDRDRVLDLSGGLVGEGEVVAGGERARVGVPGSFVRKTGLSPAAPSAGVERAIGAAALQRDQDQRRRHDNDDPDDCSVSRARAFGVRRAR